MLVRKKSKIANYYSLSNIEVRIGDITDKRSIKGLMENIDIVINCAARLGQQGTNDDFYLTNVLGTENLFQEAIKNRLSRFIHISSLAVLSDIKII